MTINQPLSLFISSKMAEMQKERYTVQEALAAYRMHGWLWEKDAGARPEPIQSTYLKEVEACDIYIGLFWKEYGEYTIEEYQHAHKYHKPSLIYVKQVDIEQRDQRLVSFLKEINRVHDGLTVYHFKSPEELAEQVQKDMMQLLISRFRDTRLQPIWNIPFPRKQFFTGREALLKSLHTRLQEKRTAVLSPRQTRTAVLGQRQAITGLGGIGKTQIAVEYAYRYRQEYQSVLWAYADTTEALNTSYTEIARLLQLPQKDAQEQEEIVWGVKDWLSKQQNWLLILDNADEPEILLPFLPPKIEGHLIVTTRAAELSHLGLGFGHALIVQKFTKKQDVPFLLHRAGIKRAFPQDRRCARLIADELDGLPLALNQVGVYLARTGSSLTAYWEMYQRQRMLLLDTYEEQDREYPRSVAATLLLSFKRVEQRNPAAADLLRLCAFLAPDAIPEELLTKGARELGDVLAPIAEDAYQLDQAFADLRAYSLLTRDPQSRTLTVHRLVQAVLRDNMSIEAKQQWMQWAIHIVEAAYPGSDFANWPAFERLLPHALICVTWIKEIPFTTPTAVLLLNQVGCYLRDRAQYGEAEPLLKYALVIQEQQLRPEHIDTATSLDNLAELYRSQGRYEEAEPLYNRALTIREQQLGASHPETASSLNNLALLYESQGRYEEAESLCHRALTIREHQLGASHPETASSLNNLALIYESQGRYEEAEPLYRRALLVQEQQLGASHPETASSLNNLAALYYFQKRYEEAEPLYRRALIIREHQLGASHPQTAISINNLAVLYFHQGKYEEAELLYQRALMIHEQYLGITHPSTATCSYNLAKLYRIQGKYEEAESLLTRALAIREQQLGSYHPETAMSSNELVLLYESQGRYEEAKLMYNRTLTIYEHLFGKSHLNTKNLREQYVDFLRSIGHDAEAVQIEQDH
jgi:tetratricopeptide (TPR) repeat protein